VLEAADGDRGAGGVLAGPALTVKVRPGDNLMLHKALDLAVPGDVIVCDGGGDLTTALIGELMLTHAVARGVAGVVINGAIRDAGAIRAHYDKIHLFDVDLPSGERWRESDAYAPGSQAVTVQTPLGMLGLSICYDLRFPDLFRALTDAGATLLSVPAAFTRPTGAAHWHVLLRARAIEAGVHVIAAAQTGEHDDGRTTYGHSLAVDPWGEVLLDMGEGAGLAMVEIDPAAVETVRARVPAITHRRAIPPVAAA
jgi:predicted amidohydrolase